MEKESYNPQTGLTSGSIAMFGAGFLFASATGISTAVQPLVAGFALLALGAGTYINYKIPEVVAKRGLP